MENLIKIQTELKAPKNLYNSFGKYNYRNCESILEAAKPLLKQYGCTLVLSDEVLCVGICNYVKATATIKDDKDSVTVSALAREAVSKKGMDDSQITGTASSYARKYALNGLFLIDDTKDADSDEYERSNRNTKTESVDSGNVFISSKDVKNINSLIEATGADVKAFLEYFKVDTTEELTVIQYAEAVKMLSKKQKNSEINA